MGDDAQEPGAVVDFLGRPAQIGSGLRFQPLVADMSEKASSAPGMLR